MIASAWGDQLVTIHALLLLGGASLALASVASAQSVDAPAANPNPPATASPPTISAPRAVPGALDQPDMPPQRIQAVVRASGFAPVGPPARRGDRYVQRALDPDAVPYRLVIDARSARIVSARPLRAPRPFGYGLVPYRLYLSP